MILKVIFQGPQVHQLLILFKPFNDSHKLINLGLLLVLLHVSQHPVMNLLEPNGIRSVLFEFCEIVRFYKLLQVIAHDDNHHGSSDAKHQDYGNETLEKLFKPRDLLNVAPVSLIIFVDLLKPLV